MGRPFIPAPNSASVELIFLIDGLYNENLLHVTKGSNYSLADLQAVRNIVITWDGANYCQQRVSNAQLVRVRTKALDSSSGPYEDYTLPTPHPGTASGGGTPIQASACLKLSTANAGRTGRGRVFIGNIPVITLASTHSFLPVALSNWVSYFTTLKANLLAGGHTWCIISYREDKAWRTQGIPRAIISHSFVSTRIATQRKRLGHM